MLSETEHAEAVGCGCTGAVAYVKFTDARAALFA
jgi:hypothetical protein